MKVIDDETVEVNPNHSQPDGNLDMSFKVLPKVDQTDLYESAWGALNKNQVVGIFPEGGSHDRSNLLPLKAGASIFALGAASKYQKNIKIQAVGLNYYRPHRFRSKVVIEFSEPFQVPEDLVKNYNDRSKKREVISNLLNMIEKNLREVMITADNYKDLMAIYMARDIIVIETSPLKKKSFAQRLELEHKVLRQVATVFEKTGQTAETQHYKQKLKNYMTELSVMNINDKALYTTKRFEKLTLVYRVTFHLVKLLGSLAFMCLGLLYILPCKYIVDSYAEKKRRDALKKSTVKIMANDVVATWKIITAMIVIIPTSLGCSLLIFIGFFYFTQFTFWIKLFLSWILALLWPIYIYCIASSFKL